VTEVATPGGPVTRIRGRFVVGFAAGDHVVYRDGEVVYQADRVRFVGHDYPSEVDREIDGSRDVAWDASRGPELAGARADPAQAWQLLAERGCSGATTSAALRPVRKPTSRWWT
jgi:hypothetical protein